MSVIDSLINQQIKKYFINLKISDNSERKIKPVITVSQENGSGGRPIAQLVAKKMRFKFYDKQLIEMIAKKANLKKSLVKSLDEKTQDTIESIINSFLGIESLPEHSYIKSLVRVVLSLSQKGKAVILGRGGNFIIPPDLALRVRIVAPLKTRLENAKKFEFPQLSYEDIKQKILKVHIERKEFIYKYFHKDISNANYYDLVINTQNISIEQASNIIIAAYKVKFQKPTFNLL